MDYSILTNVLQGKESFGTSAGGLIWYLLTLIMMGIALYHAWYANRCEANKAQLIVAVVLSILFPKLAGLYYLFTYGLPGKAGVHPIC